MIINDPVDGNAQRVKNGWAQVVSQGVSRISASSQIDKDAFAVYANRIIAVPDTDEVLLFFQNDEEKDFILSKLYISTRDTLTSFELHLNAQYVSGGTLINAKKLNTSSKKELQATIFESPSDIVATPPANNAGEVFDINVSSGQPSFEFDTDDSIIIPRDGTLLIIVNSATALAKTTATMYGYLSNVES